MGAGSPGERDSSVTVVNQTKDGRRNEPPARRGAAAAEDAREKDARAGEGGSALRRAPGGARVGTRELRPASRSRSLGRGNSRCRRPEVDTAPEVGTAWQQRPAVEPEEAGQEWVRRGARTLGPTWRGRGVGCLVRKPRDLTQELILTPRRE